MLEGSRKAVGYRRTPTDHAFRSTAFEAGPDDMFYLSTDGLADQNGGEKNYSFGKTRLKAWMSAHAERPAADQLKPLEDELDAFRGAEPQRDDITVIGFRFPRRPSTLRAPASF